MLLLGFCGLFPIALFLLTQNSSFFRPIVVRKDRKSTASRFLSMILFSSGPLDSLPSTGKVYGAFDLCGRLGLLALAAPVYAERTRPPGIPQHPRPRGLVRDVMRWPRPPRQHLLERLKL